MSLLLGTRLPPIPEECVAINAYSQELAPKLQKVPDELQELHDHISDTLKEVNKLVEKFERTVAENESTAEKTTFTHEPLYKAKELLVQLLKDLISDDTHKSIVTPHLEKHPLAHLVTIAVIHICQVAASVVNKGAETSEAYRWLLTGCKLVEKLQDSSSSSSSTKCYLTQEEMKSCIDFKYIAKYSAAPIPDFFSKVKFNTQARSAETSTVTPAAGVAAVGTSMALEMLVHAAQIWTLWTEPDNVGKIADAAQRLISNVPETGGITYKAAKDESQEGAEYYRMRQEEIKNKNSNINNNNNSLLMDEHTKNEIEKLQQFQKSAALQEAENMIRLETKRAARAKETVFVFVPPEWAKPYLKMKRHLGFIVTTPSRWRQGNVENHVFCEDRMLDMFTTIVQANRGNSNNPTSCYYSMLALQYRLPMVLHGTEDRSLLDEWIGLCLSLCEYYIEERDLSHVEHMIQVVDALMEYGGGMKNALTTLSTYKGYKTTNGVMVDLIRLKLAGMKMKLFLDSLEEEQEHLNLEKQQNKTDAAAAAASAVGGESKSAATLLESSTSSTSSSLALAAAIGAPQIADSTKAVVKMYQNELLLPEEYNGMIVTENNLPANWTSKTVDVKARISLVAKCADAALHSSAVQPPVEAQTITYGELKQLAQDNLKKFTEEGGFIIPELFKALDVNEDCERFILSRRFASELYSVIFNITKNVIVGEKRLRVLHELRNSALHENVFRNVLRQAEFEHGTQSIAVGDLMPPNSESRTKYYSQAAESLEKFCTSFEREIAKAKEANIPITLEGSDFVAFGLGAMRRVETLLKLGGKENQDAAGVCANQLVQFATTYARDGGPRLAEMKSLAQELLQVLNGNGSSGSAVNSANTASAVAAASRTVERRVVRKVVVKHKDPAGKKK